MDHVATVGIINLDGLIVDPFSTNFGIQFNGFDICIYLVGLASGYLILLLLTSRVRFSDRAKKLRRRRNNVLGVAKSPGLRSSAMGAGAVSRLKSSIVSPFQGS